MNGGEAVLRPGRPDARTGAFTARGCKRMADKLGAGASFPEVTLDLVDGGTLDLPGGLDGKYKVVLFYRGHW